MAVTSGVFDKFIAGQADGSHFVDFNSDVIKLMLVTNTYTPNQDTHEFITSVTNEVTDSTGNYVAGGQALTTKVVAINTGSDFAYFGADNVQWTGCTFTARRAILYKDTGTAATSPLIGWIDFGADQVLSAQDFRVSWAPTASGGTFKMQAA